MAWATLTTSDALTLSSSYQTVQESAADMEVSLNPGETAHLQLKFDPQATPTEWCEWAILASADGGTTYDTIPFDAGVIDDDTDPNIVTTLLRDVHTFKIQAKLIDTDGTAGGDDTASTLTVLVRKNGIDL